MTSYSEKMTVVQLCRFVRKTYSASRADRILARMHNGASYADAVYATREME